jgi:[acyl-carrier-protein] S-malonyltransferase
MAQALAGVAFRPPAVPLVSNVLARPVTDPAEIVRGLVAQVTGMVRWRESILAMAAAGVTFTYEVGSGKVLSGLIKRIAEGMGTMAIGAPEDVPAFRAASQQQAARVFGAQNV